MNRLNREEMVAEMESHLEAREQPLSDAEVLAEDDRLRREVPALLARCALARSQADPAGIVHKVRESSRTAKPEPVRAAPSSGLDVATLADALPLVIATISDNFEKQISKLEARIAALEALAERSKTLDLPRIGRNVVAA